MEKKRSVGVTVFAVLNILVGAYYFLIWAFFLDNIELPILGCIIYLILNIGLFKLKNWARIVLLVVIIPLTFIFYLNAVNFYIVRPNLPNREEVIATMKLKNTIFTLPFMVYCLAFLYFFNRPKVKEQFK